MQKLVKEFMEVFGQLPNTLTEEETYKLRVALIQEEAAELIEAVTDVEELDALVDLAYVLYGTYIHMNIPHIDTEHLYYDKEITAQEIFDAAMNIDAETLDSDLDEVLGLVTTYAQKYNFEGAFKEVHRSNMSKLGLDGKPVKRLDGKILKGPSYSAPNLIPFVQKNFA
jgi:predicted HAD superfamily Cof-like phosphohydrolase